MDGKVLAYEYLRAMAAATAAKRRLDFSDEEEEDRKEDNETKDKMLMIGMGSGALPFFMETHFSDEFEMETVEHDPVVIEAIERTCFNGNAIPFRCVVDDARDRVRGQREQDLRRRRARGRDDPGEPAGDVRDAAGHGIPAARDGETPPRRRGRTRATGAGGGERDDARRGRGVLHARAGDGGAADDGGGVREDAGAAVR